MRISYGEGEIKCKCGNIQKFKIVTQRLLRIMEFFSPTWQLVKQYSIIKASVIKQRPIWARYLK